MRMPPDVVLAQLSQCLSQPGGVYRQTFGTSFAPCLWWDMRRACLIPRSRGPCGTACLPC